MSTSGTTNFSTTRNDLINGALRLCGVLAQGETASTTQITEASEALNMMVKAYQADGMPLWALKEYPLTLVASQATYRLGNGETIDVAKPLKITQAFIRNTSTNIDIPMRVVTRYDYNMLGNKTSTGMPIQLYYDPQRSYGDINVYPVPAATQASTFQIHIIYQRPYEDFDASTDEPDFPQEWFEALKYGLADRLSGEYNISMQLRNIIKLEAREHKETALGFGTEEGSMTFAVDVRQW